MVEGRKFSQLPNHNISLNHFKNIIKTICNFDKGFIEDGQLYSLFHYDLTPSNILLTDTTAGIIDFENIEKRNISLYMNFQSKFVNKEHFQKIYHLLDDTATYPNNMRLFEIHFIHKLMQRMTYEEEMIKPKEVKLKIFDDFLCAKAYYLSMMSEFHGRIMNPMTHLLSYWENIHSALLTPAENGIREDIRLAEMYTISLAFLHYAIMEYGIQNIDLMTEYYNEAGKHFRTCYTDAKTLDDKNKIQYYENCLKYYEGFSHLYENPVKTEKQRTVPTLNEMIL